MSRRTSIVKALVRELKTIKVSNGFNSDLFEEAHDKLKFWDEVENFPSLYVVAGSESREYLPGQMSWGYLGISIKVYCKGEEPQQLLENLLEDVERIVDKNYALQYQDGQTADISITSIVTDEGLLVPYGIGEIPNLQVTAGQATQQPQTADNSLA